MSDLPMEAGAPFDRDGELDFLEDHVREALDRAGSAGATAAEVSASSSRGLSVMVRLGEVETLEHMQDRGIDITVYIGQQKGRASCADLRPRSVRECVDRAVDIARFMQEDSSNGLADSRLMAVEFPDLDLWHPVTLDAERGIQRALACEAAGRADQRITNSEGASVDAGLGLSVYGNSHGFIGRKSGTRYSQSCVLLAGRGDSMQRDYSWDSRRSLDDLEAAEVTGREAAEKTIRRLGARQIRTGQMPVLFAPDVAKSLIGHLVGAISGTALYRNASFLKDAIGERVFPDWVQIMERPHLLRGSQSAAFDAEGVATREKSFVDGGVLSSYVLSSYSARRLGLEPTANAGGVRNLLLRPGGSQTEDLAGLMQDGLYVTEVMGQGINLITGDYSRGASGFKVENGQLAYPVEEVTIAGNLRDMFRDIVAAGSDVDTRGNIHSGEILISRMTVAGE